MFEPLHLIFAACLDGSLRLYSEKLKLRSNMPWANGAVRDMAYNNKRAEVITAGSYGTPHTRAYNQHSITQQDQASLSVSKSYGPRSGSAKHVRSGPKTLALCGAIKQWNETQRPLHRAVCIYACVCVYVCTGIKAWTCDMDYEAYRNDKDVDPFAIPRSKDGQILPWAFGKYQHAVQCRQFM